MIRFLCFPMLACFAFASVAVAQSRKEPYEISYEGAGIGRKPGPPITMELTIAYERVSGTVTYGGVTEPVEGNRRDGLCTFSTPAKVFYSGFCSDKFKGKRNDYKLPSLKRETPFEVTRIASKALHIYAPADWVGLRPNHILSGSNLFELDQVVPFAALLWANEFDPDRRGLDKIIWGKVSKVQSGNETHYAFPYCYEGQCTNPDVAAPNLGIFRQGRSYDGSIAADFYAMSPNGNGTRYCRVQPVRYELPTCYDEEGVRRSVTPATLVAEARAAIPRYDKIGTAYDASHPAQVGSRKWIAEHAVCGWISIVETDAYGQKNYSSRLSCGFKP